MYVGITGQSLKERWWEHVTEARAGGKRKFCRAIRKYGATDFDVVTLYEYSSYEEACEAEIALIHMLDLVCLGYNMAPGGQLSPMLSSEVRAKVSAANKGKAPSRETVEAARLHNTGRKRTSEQIEAHRQRLLGHKTSAATRAKISAALMGHGHSAETREKISKSGKGRRHTPEARAKIAEAGRGRKQSAESIEKTRQANLGRKRTPQACANMRAAQQARRVRLSTPIEMCDA